jgi:Flp pilus assembly protein TadG
MNRSFLSPTSRTWKTESGQGLAEFALSAGILLLALFAMVDLGRATHINTMLASAAQEGARAGSFTSNTGEIANAVRNKLSMINPEEASVSVTRTRGFTTVTVSYTFQPVTPVVTAFTGTDGILLVQEVRGRNLGVITEN